MTHVELKIYAQFFQAASKDPFGTGPNRLDTLRNKVYHLWRTDGAPLTGKELLENMVNGFDAQAIIGIDIFVTGADGLYYLHVVHGIRKYTGDLRGESSLAGKYFGYLNDVEGGEAELVQLTKGLLLETGKVNVCNMT